MLSQLYHIVENQTTLSFAKVMLFNHSCTGLISVWYKQKPKALLESFLSLRV